VARSSPFGVELSAFDRRHRVKRVSDITIRGRPCQPFRAALSRFFSLLIRAAQRSFRNCKAFVGWTQAQLYNPNNAALALPLTQYDHTAVDRMLERDPTALLGHTLIVDVQPPLFDQPGRFTF
jgi:hypothetical protein